MLMVKLGNKKLMRTACSICGSDVIELKTKEPLCDDCRARIKKYD